MPSGPMLFINPEAPDDEWVCVQQGNLRAWESKIERQAGYIDELKDRISEAKYALNHTND